MYCDYCTYAGNCSYEDQGRIRGCCAAIEEEEDLTQINELVVLNWFKSMGGTRKGSFVCLNNPDYDVSNPDDCRDISGTVDGWLDKNFKPCARKHAAYAKVKRWSYNKDTCHIPESFLIDTVEW